MKEFLLLSVFIACTLSTFVSAQTKINDKKLVEFGWDYPDIQYLKKNIRTMEERPFDGVVFSIYTDILNAFDTLQLLDSYFQYQNLSAIKWKKFTDNFLLVRGCGIVGPFWLNDTSWDKITRNLVKISKALNSQNIKGLGFDPEYYLKDKDLNPWIYKPSLYKNFSYQQVGAYVTKRGRQFIKALQVYKPDITILSFWLLALAEEQKKYKSLPEVEMALFPFFVQGMLEGKNKTSKIVDGNEHGYWFQGAEKFILSGEELRAISTKLLPPMLYSKYNSEVSIAQPVYLDGVYGKLPLYEKGFNTTTKHSWLVDNLLHAYMTTDKYVWFYNERIDWWRGNIDTSVLNIINQVRKQTQPSSTAELVKGNSIKYNFKNNNKEGKNAFTFRYSRLSNDLELRINTNDIISFQLYENSKLIYEKLSPKTIEKMQLNGKYMKKGVLIIITKHQNGTYSVSYIN